MRPFVLGEYAGAREVFEHCSFGTGIPKLTLHPA